jgi:succinate dehydrogenase / fumarate reductase cytochrome b subunit
LNGATFAPKLAPASFLFPRGFLFMADNPQRPAARQRPLSPHLTIYRWPVTMMTSITHRATGVALSVGAIVLAWWLISISNGPEGWESFHAIWDTPLGLLVMFGFTWALVYHFLNGIRHLAWDLGYGFPKQTSERNSVIVIALSVVLAVALFALIWTGHGGYLQ